MDRKRLIQSVLGCEDNVTNFGCSFTLHVFSQDPTSKMLVCDDATKLLSLLNLLDIRTLPQQRIMCIRCAKWMIDPETEENKRKEGGGQLVSF